MSKPRRKTKTKAQREAEERAALLQRIEDIMEARGCDISRDEGAPCCETPVTQYEGVLRAVRARLALDSVQDETVGRWWNVGQFANQDTLTDWLYAMGVRA